MKYIIPIYTGWWFQPQYSQYMEKSKCSKPPTSISGVKSLHVSPHLRLEGFAPAPTLFKAKS